MRSPLAALVLAMAGLGLDASNPNLDLELAGSHTGTPTRTRLRIGSKGIYPTRGDRRSMMGMASFCPQSDKDDDMPRGFPGAKMLRQMKQQRFGITHRRGPQL